MYSHRALVSAIGMLLLFSCSRKGPEEGGTYPPGSASYSANGWSDAERAEYYHLPEGSELMPYALMANLKSSKTGKPFLEDMERFGFLPDGKSATNMYGLPVGLTVARSRNAGSTGMEMVGFSCAACHVGEITYRGRRLRVDGAPALIDLQGYQVEFQQSLDATMKDPRALLALIIAMDRQRKVGDTPADAGGQYASDAALQGAGDVQAAPNADPAFHSVPSRVADTAPAAPPAPGFAARLREDIAFLKARLAHIRNGRLLVDGTEPGPGRIDAFGAARNLLFTKFAVKMLSPVSFPFLWDVPDTTQQRAGNEETRWIHYDGNTNSILERNIGQALGMGAVFDPKTFESTLRIGNLHRLEVLTHKLQPPQWPADLLGPIDEDKARNGERIFKDKCEGCHQDRLFPLTEVGTDPLRAGSFGQPVGDKPFPAAVVPILDGLKKRAFLDDGISTADQAAMDANPVVWRATGQYMARRLRSIWATAPFLHNGSVPTLYALLHPDQRPAKFTVGIREYDPTRLGYQSDVGSTGPNVWTYDTSKPGNANIGHSGEKFGTTLPDDQKAALLEYLKKL